MALVPGFVEPYRRIFFAPVEFTFNVGFDAVFVFVIFKWIVTPTMR